MSGIVLMATAAVALIWANSPWSAQYVSFWEPFLHWINDGLMAVFFFLVGLEIKREILIGELASVQKATLPIVAALGGMLVPALIYVGLNGGGPGARGWGIPMATDIAFALGVLNLLGSRVPLALKVFLAAVAIADDIGAVAVIALFYSSNIQWGLLGLAALLVAGLFALNRMGVRNLLVYILLGLVLWFLFLKSGIHATIAGVLLATTIPRSRVEELEHALQPWVSYLIMPLFALANAGVSLAGGAIDRVGMGVAAGLVIGKPIGVATASWLAVKAKIAELPEGVDWRQLLGAGVLAGIGFTMSLFISDLAFEDAAMLIEAKIAILGASVLMGLAGFAILRSSRAAD